MFFYWSWLYCIENWWGHWPWSIMEKGQVPKPFCWWTGMSNNILARAGKMRTHLNQPFKKPFAKLVVDPTTPPTNKTDSTRLRWSRAPHQESSLGKGIHFSLLSWVSKKNNQTMQPRCCHKMWWWQPSKKSLKFTGGRSINGYWS